MNNNDKYFKLTTSYLIKKINFCSKLILFIIIFTYSLSFHFLNDAFYKSVQADTTISQLVPDQSFDTGNHIYPPQSNQNSALWTNIGSAETVETSTFSVNLVNNKSKSAGYALFNGAIDMTQKVSFSGNFSLQANSSTNPFAAGDSLGFILTPKSTDFIANNLKSNLAADGTSNVVGKYLGELIKQAYPTTSVPNTGSTITENMKIDWQPSSTLTNDKNVTGELTYTISSENRGKATTLSEKITVARSMSLGIIGSTGGNFGRLTYSSTEDEFNAYKGTQSVQVNYLDQDTNRPITNFSPSIIKANVGDTIKVLGKQLRDIVDINTFSFLTPEIPGYIFVSAPPLVVANNDSENNVINVTYKKLPIGKAHFNYQYSSDVVDQSILLPTINDTEGEINEAVIMPELPNLPDNYYISKVVTTDGQQYATLKDAISGEKYKNQELHFTLIVSKVVVLTTSDNNSSKQSSTAERKNEQGKQTSKDSTTVDQPQEQETIKKEAIHKNEKPNSESNDTFKEVNKEIDSPLKLPLKMPTEISQMPQSSVVAINNEQSKYPNVSAHNLEIQVAGTAGIFAGGVVAIGTITGFNKFYKFLKIVKK
ncbi:lectin-like domain-containing protein [Lactococcus lactis]